MSKIKQFRQQIDEFMGRHPQSPLDRKAQRKFKGLNYYKVDKAWKFEVEVVRFSAENTPITMQTSTGAVAEYYKFGHFTVEVGGEKATLTIYSDPSGSDLFLPFKDATNGQKTYGAGRYLDNHRPGIVPLSGDRFEINFNYAYNPYCAYSTAYSCPLPPRENWLSVEINSGEKIWKSK